MILHNHVYLCVVRIDGQQISSEARTKQELDLPARLDVWKRDVRRASARYGDPGLDGRFYMPPTNFVDLPRRQGRSLNKKDLRRAIGIDRSLRYVSKS